MSNKYSTYIYLLILLIIFLAGGFKKKKPKEDGSGNETRAGTPATEKLASSLGRMITGTGLADVLLDQTEEPEQEDFSGDSFDEPDLKKEPADEKMNREAFLPSEEEGISSFSVVDNHTDESGAKKEVWNDGQYNIDSNQMSDQQEENETCLEDIVDDFDPVKAIIYSEIFDRKYF